jgi:hypothetical protein
LCWVGLVVLGLVVLGWSGCAGSSCAGLGCVRGIGKVWGPCVVDLERARSEVRTACAPQSVWFDWGVGVRGGQWDAEMGAAACLAGTQKRGASRRTL